MYSKLLCYSIFTAFLFAAFSSEAEDNQKVNGVLSNQNVFSNPNKDQTMFDGFLNIKAAHERRNDYAFGPKNASAVALNPVVFINNKISLEADFYYGHQYSFTPSVYGLRYLSSTIPDSELAYFHDNFKEIGPHYSKAMNKNINEAHFYRSYTRLTYNDEARNFRIVLGDTTTRNQIGNQQAVGGMGISIFRQGGNGSVVNSSSPIVLTRPSKIECKLGDDILAIRVLPPGTYYLDDLPEEAKIPGVKLKISDQLKRNEVLTVDYFGGYGMPKAGEDDFDISLIFANKYDLDDPYRVKYDDDPHFSTNYRRGITDDFTVGVGLQTYKSAYQLDATVIYNSPAGKISPHISYNDSKSLGHGMAAGIYYMTPVNEAGIVLEAFFGVKAKGFGDLRKAKEEGDAYNKFMEKYFPNDDLKERFKRTTAEDSSRQIIARLYAKPILGIITPSFTFNGQWSSGNRLREYTLALTAKVFEKATFTVSGGLSYDDPYKGVNRASPDRRLAVALTIPLGDVEIGGSYLHHDDNRLRGYTKLQYNPSQIKGLELLVEDYFKPGYQNPQASIKYEGEHFDIKVEESITNTYRNSAEKKISHSNQQRFFFGTSISPSSMRPYQKSNVNILRTLKDYRK